MNQSIDVFEAGELLASLVDKSLVVFDEALGRYRLLETVRQYARDRLFETGEGAAWRDRHLAHFRTLCQRATPELRGKDQRLWLDRLEAEHDNLRSALEWSSGPGGDTLRGLELACAINRYWDTRGHAAEGSAWLIGLLAQGASEQPPTTRAQALSAVGHLMYCRGEYGQAQSFFEESLLISRALGELLDVGGALNGLGNAKWAQGQHLDARAHYIESLEIRRNLGDRLGESASLNNLGNVAFGESSFEEAQTFFERCLAILQELGVPNMKTPALNNLGGLCFFQGKFSEARIHYAESLRICSDQRDYGGIAGPLDGLALLIAVAGNHLAAARLWGTTERLREQFDRALPPDERPRYEEHVAKARASLGNEADFEQAWQEGRALTLEQAIELALTESSS